jgi:hypothetical protein
MLLAEKSLALHEAVKQMGFDSLEDFALIKAKEKLLNEIIICTNNIETFEKKYGLDYADFCLKFQQLQQPLFQREEDSAEWNAELKQLMILQKRLARLS